MHEAPWRSGLALETSLAVSRQEPDVAASMSSQHGVGRAEVLYSGALRAAALLVRAPPLLRTVAAMKAVLTWHRQAGLKQLRSIFTFRNLQ